MGKTLLRQLLDATEEKGMKPGRVAIALGVSKQTYTNWKLRGNVPPKELKRVAEYLKKSTDELLDIRGAKPARIAEPSTLYGYGVNEEGARFAADWQQLEPDQRAALQTIVELAVAELKRRRLKEGRASKGTTSTRQPSAAVSVRPRTTS